jgi:hypothetical protein
MDELTCDFCGEPLDRAELDRLMAAQGSPVAQWLRDTVEEEVRGTGFAAIHMCTPCRTDEERAQRLADELDEEKALAIAERAINRALRAQEMHRETRGEG